jgi:Zn-dependent protease with chaperone function
LLIGIVIGFLFLWVPYLLLKKSPRRWWLYTGLLAIPFLILVILVQPVWIDPLFNKFGPMNNKDLEAKILALAEKAGIEGSRVYEVAKSEDTKALNAYVTGFGATKRIVLWDTTLAKLDEDELLFVMGHEMGHYVLGHVWKSILFFSLLIIVTLYAIHRTAGWMIGKFHRRFGFTELSDMASLPLIILLFSAYFLIVTPVALAFSRHNERESDRFGLEITQNNRAAATAFVKLQQENLAVPRPHVLVKLWRASHPTLGERIDFCNEYRPWQRGEALRYGEVFK